MARAAFIENKAEVRSKIAKQENKVLHPLIKMHFYRKNLLLL